MKTVLILWFENDVKEYGIQTLGLCVKWKVWFENDVKEYGIQTFLIDHIDNFSLRMM